MFSITVLVSRTIPWILLFKTEEAATKSITELKALMGMSAEVASRSFSDDFGQSIVTREIYGFLLEDLDKSRLARIEMGLHNARTQLAMNRQAETDPALRQSRMQQGPAVITPGMPNGPRAF